MKIEKDEFEKLQQGFFEIQVKGDVDTTNGIYLSPDAFDFEYYKKETDMGVIPGVIASSIRTGSEPSFNAPRNLTAFVNTSNQAVLGWAQDSTNETAFYIERSDNGGAFSVIGTVGANVVTYTDSTIVQNVKYVYRVRAYDGSVYTDYSNEASAAIMYAYDFDGTNDRLSFPHSTSLSMERTQAQSYEMWVMFPTIKDTTKRLYAKYDNTANRGVLINVGTDALLSVFFRNGASNSLNVKTNSNALVSGTFWANKWYHVVVTYAGTSTAAGVKIYIDGVVCSLYFTAAATLSATIVNTQPVAIGSDSPGTAFSRHQQAVTRVFNKELTQAEITTLYNKGLPLYSTSITGKVFEMLVNADVHGGTNFAVQETALSNNGTSSGMTAAGKISVTNIDSIRATDIQTYTGESFYYDTFGDAGDGDLTVLMHSPYTDRRTNILYDSATGKTWLAWMRRGNLGWNRESMLFYLDHTGKFASPSGRAGYLTAGTIDGHASPSILLTPDGEIMLVHENIHNSPIYVKKTTGKDPKTLAQVSVVPNDLSYPILTRIGSRIFMWARVGTDPLTKDYINWSDNSGATWIGARMVLNLDNSTGVDRAYYVPVYDPNKLRYFVCMREDNILMFTKIFYIESTDGSVWKNFTNTFSKSVTPSTATAYTRAEMDTNCTVWYDSDNDLHMKCAVLTPSGKVVGIANDTVNNYRFLYHNGTAWQSRPLAMPLYIPTANGNESRGDYWFMYAYSDTQFVVFRIEPRGGFDVVVKYTTTDAFVTWDAGTIVSDTNKKHEQLQGTYNLNDAVKITIACNQVGSTYNKLFIHEWTP